MNLRRVIFTDKPIDKVIATQTQMIMLHEQLYAIMKLHMQALQECSQENPLMGLMVQVYSQVIEGEEKTIGSCRNVLKKYKKFKRSFEDPDYFGDDEDTDLQDQEDQKDQADQEE